MGEISDIAIADLLYLLALRRQSGKLAVTSNGEEVSLYLNKGQLIFVSSSNASLRLGRLLTKMGFIDGERLQEALQSQEKGSRNQPLGQVLLKGGYISEAQLAECIEEQCIEVLARIISAQEGIFVFYPNAPAPPGTELVPLNADRILLDASRRTDELVLLRELVPNERAPLELTETVDEIADLLSDAEVVIAAALKPGSASLADLCELGVMDELTLWRTLISMRERGLVIVGLNAQSDRRPSLSSFALTGPLDATV
jgi:hypothetical protein